MHEIGEIWEKFPIVPDYYSSRRGIPKDTPRSAKFFPKPELLSGPAQRKPMTPAQREKRNTRNRIAKASRQRNRP